MLENQGQNICMGLVRQTKHTVYILVRLEMFSESQLKINTKLEGKLTCNQGTKI